MPLVFRAASKAALRFPNAQKPIGDFLSRSVPSWSFRDIICLVTYTTLYNTHTMKPVLNGMRRVAILAF